MNTLLHSTTLTSKNGHYWVRAVADAASPKWSPETYVPLVPGRTYTLTMFDIHGKPNIQTGVADVNGRVWFDVLAAEMRVGSLEDKSSASPYFKTSAVRHG